MGELLKECDEHKGAGLQKIWTTNAACINALPGPMKEALVAQKDTIKKKYL